MAQFCFSKYKIEALHGMFELFGMIETVYTVMNPTR